MRIIGAYLLAVLGGNDNPDASTINTILDSVGIKAEADQVELVISKLKGKDLNQLIEEGSKRLSSAPGKLYITARICECDVMYTDLVYAVKNCGLNA